MTAIAYSADEVARLRGWLEWIAEASAQAERGEIQGGAQDALAGKAAPGVQVAPPADCDGDLAALDCCSGCAWCSDGEHCPKCCAEGLPF